MGTGGRQDSTLRFCPCLANIRQASHLKTLVEIRKGKRSFVKSVSVPNRLGVTRFGADNHSRNIFLWGGCHPKQRNRSQLVPCHTRSPPPAFLHSCLGEGLRKAVLASRTLTSYEEDLRQHSTLLFIRSHRECANWWTSRHVRVPCLYVCTVCPQTCPRCAMTGRSRSQGLWERESFSLVLSREGSCESLRLTILASINLLKNKDVF